MDWAKASSFPISVRLLVGNGGVGKTRLALELCKRLEHEQWATGFLNGDCDSKQASEFGKILAGEKKCTLIVIDYAETRQLVLIELLRELIQSEFSHRVRILLLARDSGDWWDLLLQRDKVCEPLLMGMATSGPIFVPELYENPSDRQDAYQVALTTFAAHLSVSSPNHSPPLNEEHFGHPLYIHMAALIALSGERPRSAESLSRALVGHERRYWKRAIIDEALTGAEIEESAALLMTLVTLVNGVITSRDVESIWIGVGGSKKVLALLFKKLKSLYPGRKGLDPWRPDLLGEALIAQVLLTSAGSKLLAAVLSQGNRAYRQSCLTVLGRLLRNRVDLLTVVEDAICTSFAKCANDLISACIESPSQIPLVAEGAFKRLNSKTQVLVALQIQQHMNFDVMPLSGLDVAVSRVLLNREKTVSPDREKQYRYAHALGNLAIALSRNAETAEALEVASEELQVYRDISTVKPALVAAELAIAIDRVAGLSSRMGDSEAAITIAKDALAIHRRLAKDGSDKEHRNLANSLNNYVTYLTDQNRDSEAFAVSTEALQIIKRLYEKDGEKYRNDYVGAMQNYAGRLEEQGDFAGALASSDVALSIRQQQAEKWPERYLHYFADVLSNHASLLGAVGRLAESVSVDRQALSIREELVILKPERFKSSVSISCNNLAASYSFMGDSNEATRFDLRAIDIRTVLAESQPQVYESDLACSLSNYGVHLGELGRIQSAINADIRALDIRKCLHKENPERFGADLATSYSNLAEHFASLGNWNDADVHETQAIFLLDEAALVNPSRWVFQRERSRILASFWKWLSNSSFQMEFEISSEILAVLKSREIPALQFFSGFARQGTHPNDEELGKLLGGWSNIHYAHQHALREYYLALSALAEHRRCNPSINAMWKVELKKYLNQTKGWFPPWGIEFIARQGCKFEPIEAAA